MRLLLRKHFNRPLKMLYRYKSKWYMPPKLKSKYGISKAKLLQKDFKRINKKTRNTIIKNHYQSIQKEKNFEFSIHKDAIPLLRKEKHTLPYSRKFIRTKSLKIRVNLKKKKNLIKKFLNKVLKENLDAKNKSRKIISIVKSAQIINKFVVKTKAITSLSKIKKVVLNKYENKQLLKKRLINTMTLASKYFSNYSAVQNNILTTFALLRKKKDLKKVYLMLNYLKAKQTLITFKLKEKERFVYNQEIIDSNFLENNFREIWGETPAKNLSDFFLSKIKKNYKKPTYRLITQHNLKKSLQFRLKKKGKYKKNYDKMYYKKRRIIFEEKSYNRLGVNDIKKKELKMKRLPFSLLNLNVRRAGVVFDVRFLKMNLVAQVKGLLKRKKKKLLFLNPVTLMKKLHKISLLKNKYQLRHLIKAKFTSFVRLLKLELKKNNKKIKKYTRKILFYKRQKGLFYRKKKIEILNIREYYIRENHKLREEIKFYRYTWKNSPFFNYNKVKQDKLNLIIGLRKQRTYLFNILKKYPEGMSAIKERIKNNQYYTGLSLLKRKLE